MIEFYWEAFFLTLQLVGLVDRLKSLVEPCCEIKSNNNPFRKPCLLTAPLLTSMQYEIHALAPQLPRLICSVDI